MSSDRCWKVQELEGGIRLVTLDCPDRAVNTFSRRVLTELNAILDELQRPGDCSGVLFASGKEDSFIAGADLEEIARLEDRKEVEELIKLGVNTFRRVERLPVPTVALVNGACLGGGLEFALACDYVVAAETRRTLLGFPEVLLGILPAWGGTVRARRRVGLQRALQLVLTGQRLNGRQAKKLGLVDDVVPPEALLAAGRWFVKNAPPRKKPLTRLLTDNRWVGRLIIRVARRRVLRETGGQYPAPLAVLDVFETGVRQGAKQQYAAEARAALELSRHPVTAQLMRLFFLGEEAKRHARECVQSDEPIRSVAVVGAGLMGSGIAGLLADRGITVRLKDVSPEILARAMRRIRDHLAREVQRGRLSRRDAERVVRRIHPTHEYSGFRRVQAVIEAVVEDAAIKKEVYEQLARCTAPETPILTNTSSFSLATLSLPGMEHRLAALHFFNPAHRMRLVEVSSLEETDPVARSRAVQLALALGKIPVLVRDCAGFVVNRLLGIYLNHAIELLPVFDDPLRLESAMKRFGFPMGPLELLDLVGLHVAEKVAVNLHQAYGSRFRPPRLFEELRRRQKDEPVRLIERDWRGKPKVSGPLAQALKSARSGGAPADRLPAEPDALAQFVLAPMLNEAVLLCEEGIVDSPDYVDLAMVLGTGFPPFRGGPLSYGDSLGWDRVMELLTKIAKRRPEFEPCGLLRKLAQGGRLTRTRLDPTQGTVPPQTPPGGETKEDNSAPIPLADTKEPPSASPESPPPDSR